MHVAVEDATGVDVVDAAAANEEMMEFAWPEILAVPEVMEEAIEETIEATLPGMTAALDSTEAKDDNDD